MICEIISGLYISTTENYIQKDRIHYVMIKVSFLIIMCINYILVMSILGMTSLYSNQNYNSNTANIGSDREAEEDYYRANQSIHDDMDETDWRFSIKCFNAYILEYLNSPSEWFGKAVINLVIAHLSIGEFFEAKTTLNVYGTICLSGLIIDDWITKIDNAQNNRRPGEQASITALINEMKSFNATNNSKDK